jgi:hypothetical protein
MLSSRVKKREAMEQVYLFRPEFEAANDNQVALERPESEAYHQANPEVYELIKRFTFQVIAAGFEHYSITSIYERVRWHTMVETSGDPFKINNNHRAYYARKFMEDHPEHRGFFRTREQGVA